MYLNEVEGKGGIRVRTVAASVANSINLYTLELRYPRFIHSQFMTHRMFSRNASSSRAIPVKKMLEMVYDDPAKPIFWGSNKAGMQAGDEIKGNALIDAKLAWDTALDDVITEADDLARFGAHKQIVNRLLEPFQFITVVVTATEWDNFFHLRLDDAAQPEIQELARCIKEAQEGVTPTTLNPGAWHLPYLKDNEYHIFGDGIHGVSVDIRGFENARLVSASRCARVSYLNHDNTKPDIDKDLALADKLLKSGHMSPFEHQATPMETVYEKGADFWEDGVTHQDKYYKYWSNNFRGWIQYRALLQ